MSHTNNPRNAQLSNMRARIAQVINQPMQYIPSHIIATCVGMGMDNNATLDFDKRMAASRAAVRVNTHKDDTDRKTKTEGGLHPFYVSLHGNGTGSEAEKGERKALLSATLTDVFDTVSES